MKSSSEVKKGFSNSFEHVHTFGMVGKMGNQSNYFKLPTDIKISIKHSCILISDTGNKRIQIFDYHTREYKLSIQLKSQRPQHLCIEHENCNQVDKQHDDDDEHENEALYFTCGDTSCVFKFNLTKYLNTFNQLSDHSNNNNLDINNFIIWKSQKLNNPQGIIVDYQHDISNNTNENTTTSIINNNLIYVGELGTGRMRILRSIDGIDTQNNEFRYKCRPYYMSNIFNNGNNFLVSEPIFEDRIQLFKRNVKNGSENQEEGEWKSILKIGKKGNGELEFQNPYGIIYDEVNNNILISDSFNNRIVILNQEGKLIKIFGKRGQNVNEFCTPNGLFLDYLKGELYVCDFANQRVLIFK